MGQSVTVYDEYFPEHLTKPYKLAKPIGQACSGVCLPICLSTRFKSEKKKMVVKDSSMVFLERVEENKQYRGITWRQGFAEGQPEYTKFPFGIRKVTPASRLVEG